MAHLNFHRRPLSGRRGTQTISSTIPTRFIGEFPYNLGEIIKVLDHAKEDSLVEVMVDIVAYGHYSNPEAFLAYKYKLEQLARHRRIRLRMVVYGERLNEKSRTEQFEQHTSNDEFTALQNTERFKDFFAKVPEKEQPKNYSDFVLFLAKREKEAEAVISDKGAEIAHCEEQFPLFFWLVDGREAAFTFQMHLPHYHEMCFYTRDPNLIRTFSELFEQAWRPSVQVAAVK